MTEPVIEFHATDSKFAPIYVCGNCRMLGGVVDRNNSREAAAKCCICTQCNERLKTKYMTVCDECSKENQTKLRLEDQQKLEALPEVEYDGGRVYYEQTGNFYDELEDCIDALEWHEISKETVIIHPCDEQILYVPSLIEFIEERWHEELEEAELRKEDRETLEAVENQIVAPTVWNPNTKVRLHRSWLDEKSDHDS